VSNSTSDTSPAETFTELKTMLTDYARQETVGPLKLLGKWVAFGVGGAVFVAIGLAYFAFGFLRWAQTLDVFSGDTRNFWPYLITFGGLLICTLVASWAMTRKFSNEEEL
jgi:hypothetical protein